MSINKGFGGRALLQHGMTLVELVMAIVIISIGLAGILAVFSSTVKSSADPMMRKQMLAIAEELMEEIASKPYAPEPNAAPGGCARNTFNDISDFDGYGTTGVICDADGNQIPALAGYSVGVAVVADAAAFSSYGVTAASRITVTVTYQSQSISLISWRTNYAS
ncbi:hypothetical protein GALL_524510 [mine drainage metagenome]|uniref:Uncharacterized protein n=1 Tax=mine drainage metagenome TaxID=410659 RepID=A0A1J5P358_9ZZZZ